MTVVGLIMIVLGFVVLACGAASDDEEGGKVMCAFGGFVIALSFEFLLPPFRDRTNDSFKVKTKDEVVITKEVFIDSNNKADTTYYYLFVNSDVMPKD